jgi:UDP-glucuronate 4-epimerase
MVRGTPSAVASDPDLAENAPMKILVTGTAGFIGCAVAEALLERGDEVAGVDSLSDYYDPSLKRARLERITSSPRYRHAEFDLADADRTFALFERERPDRVIHLAAQAGVRYSIDHPLVYGEANLSAFLNVLEASRHHGVDHLTYASSSSVYGGNTKTPFSEGDAVDHPISLYAATKRANELMAHTYSHLYALPTTGLRFFTVYGPWGRPDMSPFIFVRRILEGQPIDVYNRGDHRRDFTYIDDIVEGVLRTSDRPATPDPAYDPARPDPATSSAPWRIFNIGCERPVELLRYIEVIEECTGRKAVKNLLPLQPGDVRETYADVSALVRAVGYRPKVPLEEGMARFVDWYRRFYGV